MKKILPLTTSLFLVLLTNNALANNQKEINQQFRADILETRKNIESQSHQERISILQNADSCIHSASTPEGYKICEQQEKQARKTLKETTKTQNEALKTQIQNHHNERKTLREQRRQNHQKP